MAKINKRSHVDSDEEEETPDPNAVPTDFTSREAKFWEAKSKATERNWKKRKEEEMICKICGESGHFTQVLRAASWKTSW
jgi:formylmethanofuran dehydrogenase subunit E